MLKDTVVIEGEVSLISQIDGDPSLLSEVDGDPNVIIAEGMTPTYPHYSGSYTVTPSGSVQVLDTSDTIMDDDVTVEAIQAGSATTPATIITADPTISVSSGGLITATVSKTQQITPTVVEGYVETGTPGNVGVSGSAVQQLTTQGAQTIHPASTDQSIASGKYLTGAQTFKAVTVSGLTADKVLQGNVVKIGDADDDDRIMSVTGTASGGITPTGTKSITANGTGIDVYSYQYADVAVPNSYSASDEGKVVSNGALVAQTSDTVTENGVVDTTLIDELTVNVPTGGGGISIDDIATNTAPSGAITLGSGVTSIENYAFAGKPITSITAPSVTSVGLNSLQDTQITDIDDTNFPSLGVSSQYSVYLRISALQHIKLSGQKITLANGSGALRDNANLITAEFPHCAENVGASVSIMGASTFYVDTKLEMVDIGSCGSVGSLAFVNCAKLATIIMRKTTLVTLSNVNAFNGSSFKSGGTGGDIYIPKVLYDQLGTGTNDYKAATNWSTVDGYGTITWHQIEGSIYEL